MPDWCLVTDIDGTLIGGAASIPQLRQAVLSERRDLEARGSRLRWVIATGRRIESTREVLLESRFELGDFNALAAQSPKLAGVTPAPWPYFWNATVK